MSRGSAIIAILIAFVGGIAIGHVTGRSGTSGAPVADSGAAAVAAEPEGAEAIERFKVPVTDKQPSKGPADALVTIVEISDFECPFCSRVNPTMSRIMNDYKGKVRVVWRNNPLPSHRNAVPAHVAAMEAFKQGGSDKFWKMHDKLFENQRELTRENLEKWGAEIGLDVGKLKAALDGNDHRATITEDQQVAAKLGARGTPAFFVNGRKLMGAQPFEQFKAIIDDEIQRAEALIGTGVPRARVYAELTKNAKTEATPEQPAADQPRPQQPDPAAVYKVPVGNEPSKGPKDALVTIVEFSEFECPFCSRVEPTLKEITEKYGKDVRIVWMNNPLPFHKNAMPAAIAALEAYEQGGEAKFWAMHKLLFENQRELTRENLEKFAQQVGLNMGKFKQALDTEKHKETIQKQQALAQQLGASGTPSFFINGRNLRGAQPVAAFTAVIDEELAKAKKLVESGTPRARVYEEVIKNGATSQQFAKAADAPARPEAPPADQVYQIAVPKDAPRKGGKNAKVVIQEFSDFECPFCNRVNPTIKQVMDEYGDKVAIVWRNYPLPFHQNAKLAHEAAMEIHRQGGDAKFWKYHDLLFENQRALTRADLEKYAEQVGGINMGQFKQALDSNRNAAKIEADMKAVEQAGARIGTPSFFVNGRLVQGAQPFPAFKAAIDRALEEAK